MGIPPYAWTHDPCTKRMKDVWIIQARSTLFVGAFVSPTKSNPTMMVGLSYRISKWNWCVGKAQREVCKKKLQKLIQGNTRGDTISI